VITEVIDGKRHRTYEAEDFITVIDRYIDNLEARAAEEDPWTLAEMQRLQDKLAAAQLRTAARLRTAGYTWEAIGFNFGLNAVQAHKRFAAKIKDIEV
jgi:hypothetical protein